MILNLYLARKSYETTVVTAKWFFSETVIFNKKIPTRKMSTRVWKKKDLNPSLELNEAVEVKIESLSSSCELV